LVIGSFFTTIGSVLILKISCTAFLVEHVILLFEV